MKKTTHRMTKSTVILGAKVGALVAATLVLFNADLTMLFSDAIQNDTTSYLLIIPFLLIFALYRKRQMLSAVTRDSDDNKPRNTRHLSLIVGILTTAIAIVVYWYGSYTFTPLEYHVITLPFFVAGLTLTIFNPQTLRQLAFPIFLLFFLVPPPADVLYNLGTALSILSSMASNAFVNLIGIPSTLTSENANPIILITRPDASTIPFAVDIACSGIYSLMGFAIFGVFVAFIIRDKLWKKAAIIAIGAPLIYFLNITRITSILIIGYQYGEDLALQIFHLLSGWIVVLIGTLILLVISDKIFKTQIFTKTTNKCPTCSPIQSNTYSFCQRCGKIIKNAPAQIHASDIVKLSSILIIVLLLVSIQAPVFALTQSRPAITVDTGTGQLTSGIVPQNLKNYDLTYETRDTDFERTAKVDMALKYLYTPKNTSQHAVWVMMEIGTSQSRLHRWETCLITWPISKGLQPEVTQIKLEDTQLTENPPIIARFFAFNYTQSKEIQAVYYWFESTPFVVNSTSQTKIVETSLVAYPTNTSDVTPTQNQLHEFGVELAQYWQPIKAWSQVTMLISRNGLSMAAVLTACLIAMFAYSIIDHRKNKTTAKMTYQKFSSENTKIVDAVQKTQETQIPTLENIASTYSKTNDESIEVKELYDKLSSLEKTGVIKRTITNKYDEPTLTWKTTTAKLL